jgi:transposase
VIGEASRNHLGEELYELLRDAARGTVALPGAQTVLTDEIGMQLELLATYERQIDAVEELMVRTMEGAPEAAALLLIPKLGAVTAAVFLGSIGDPAAYDSSPSGTACCRHVARREGERAHAGETAALEARPPGAAPSGLHVRDPQRQPRRDLQAQLHARTGRESEDAEKEAAGGDRPEVDPAHVQRREQPSLLHSGTATVGQVSHSLRQGK